MGTSTLSPPNSSFNEVLNAFANGIVMATGGAKGSASDLTNTTTGPLYGALNSFFTTTISNPTGKPKAYLNWILVDEQFKYVSSYPQSGAMLVGAAGPSGTQLQAPLAYNGIPITKNGYLYVWVSNETPGWDVFFDNLSVKHYTGAMLEETHYYPFGLTMAGISSKALKPNYAENHKEFNGIEHTTDFDLNQYDAFYRTLDPQIGRFWQADPETDMLESYSPYESMGNNPISNIDPYGNFKTRFGAWWNRLWHGGGAIKKNDLGEWFVYKSEISVSGDGTPTITAKPYYGKGRNQYSAGVEDYLEAQQQREYVDDMVRLGVLKRTSSLEEAKRDNFRAFVGALMPNILKLGTVASNLPKVQQVESVANKVEITFGKNANQIYHAFRHTDEMGLAREAVQAAIKEHLPTVVSQLVEGKPLNQIVEVAGRRVQYTAYKLSDGTINVGRIHGIN